MYGVDKKRDFQENLAQDLLKAIAGFVSLVTMPIGLPKARNLRRQIAFE